jgi:hypothetical protein
MIKKILFLFFVTFITTANTAIAQYNLEWSALINGNGDTTEVMESYYNQLITKSDSGNVYVGANSIIGNSQDILISKLSSTGNILWTVQHDNGTQTIDYLHAIYVDSIDNLYALASYRNSATDWDIQLLKFNALGNLIWTSEFSTIANGGIDLGSEMIYDTTNGTFVLCGISSQSTYNYWVLRMSPNGNILDTFTYNGGTGSYGYPSHCEINNIGEIYLTGQFKNTVDNSDDGLLIKLDSSLNVIWIRTHGGSNGGGDYFYDLAIDYSGCPVVVGNESQGTVNEKFLILKYDTNGNVLWTDNYTNTYYQSGTFRRVTVDAQGGIYVIGESDSLSVVNLNTIKYSTSGIVLWTRSFCGVGMTSAVATAVSYQSGLVASIGYSVSPINGIITVYDTIGNTIWQHESNSSVGDEAYFSGQMESSGNIYVSGISFNAATGNNDLWVEKFSPVSLNFGNINQSVFGFYPNPTIDKIVLKSAVNSYRVFNSIGKVVLSEERGIFHEINLETLSGGIYIIELNNGSTTVRVLKH